MYDIETVITTYRFDIFGLNILFNFPYQLFKKHGRKFWFYMFNLLKVFARKQRAYKIWKLDFGALFAACFSNLKCILFSFVSPLPPRRWSIKRNNYYYVNILTIIKNQNDADKERWERGYWLSESWPMFTTDNTITKRY